MIKSLRIAAILALSTSALAASAVSAAPVVTDTVSGSAGAWTHTFTVENTLGGTNGIYFFGVLIPNGTPQSAPAGWNSTDHPTWDNTAFGGSSTVYNNNWIDPSATGFAPGTSGVFTVLENSQTALTGVQWFAYAYLGTYDGGDNFGPSYNPGFEGIAGTGAVPEPSAWALMILGMGAVGAAMRRRKPSLSVSYA